MNKQHEALTSVVDDTKRMTKEELQTKFDESRVGCVGTAVLGSVPKNLKRDAISSALVAIGMVGLAFSYELSAVKVCLGLIVGGFTMRLYTGNKS